MKIAILGGSFDPVHVGHLFVAEEVRINLGYERLVFVPAYQPPHKNDAPAAGPEHRLRMLELALDGREDFLVETWEIDNRGVSYTIDTVRHLYDRYPVDGRLGLIIGDDLVDGFHTWKGAEELEDMVDIIIATRQGETSARFRHSTIDNSPLPVSSSEVRERVRAGKAYRYLVPESVYGYIRTHALYKR
ncbi:MAG: nicotinate (nicotinamide) nucleotide adenylyltransferase [Spirochaetes bacterium]|nr:nicotinate (nicotinamide) nucleotide adenylyltransferase [Spirochaetota bacterium]